MTTLVIHPKDKTTDFLKPIYRDLPNMSVITGNVDQNTLHNLIRLHDQILFMGHGSPRGLFAPSQYKTNELRYPLYIVNDQTVEVLRDKDRVLYLWCHADQFVRWNKLNGMFSGMFISEMSEARYCGVKADLKHVNESNDVFAALLGESLKSNGSVGSMWGEVKEAYGTLAENNPVAQYNFERWFINFPSDLVV